MTALCGRAGPAPRDMTRPATWTDCRVRLGRIRKGLPTAVMPPSRDWVRGTAEDAKEGGSSGVAPHTVDASCHESSAGALVDCLRKPPLGEH